MNKTKIEWVQNPDGTPGYTWNPITGCINHTNGMCKGGGFPCYAYGLANGRLKQRYLKNSTIANPVVALPKNKTDGRVYDPFYPRFWPERMWLYNLVGIKKKLKGIFVCDMSDLFGVGVPEEWTRRVIDVIQKHTRHRFYLLTKQPQNLANFSPFPDNCWVGVTATNYTMMLEALNELCSIEGKVIYLSLEPLLSWEHPWDSKVIGDMLSSQQLDWVIIGAQTNPNKLPDWEWVKEIIEACDKAEIPVFLKDNLRWPRLSADGSPPYYKKTPTGTMELRQELPK